MEINDYITLKLTHSIHTSERLSFRGCRRRWNWIFGHGYYPQTTAKPLEFGTAFHKAMEKWYDPAFWNKDAETRLTLAELEFKNTCNQQKATYLKDREGNIDAEVEADFKERVELGVGMLRYHCKNVSPKLDRGLRPIQTEIEFEVPITDNNGNPIWCKCDSCWQLWRNSDVGRKDIDAYIQRARDDDDRKWWQAKGYDDPYKFLTDKWYRHKWQGLPVAYGGRIDALMQDEYGRIWVVDWKTAARLSGQEEGDSPDEFIQLDDQVTSYCWAMWVLGIEVAGFIHHEIKKAFPLPPEPNKVKRQGCWYSVNKQQNTSYELYLETIREGDPVGYDSGAYNEFLEYLKETGPRYYSRKQVVRSEAELRNAGWNIAMEAMEMIRPNLPIYPSPGRFACSFCAFRQPCIATNRDEDVEYLFASSYDVRSRRYWEHTLPSTDSKGGQ